MKTLFLEAPYQGIISLCGDTLDYLKKKEYKKIALYTAIQFLPQIEKIKKQLSAQGVEVVISRARRANYEHQLLGCNISLASLNLTVKQLAEIDAFLFVGDGKFHPLALIYAQKELPALKEVICDDPTQRKMRLLGLEEARASLRKFRVNLFKFYRAAKIGVIISLKPGQEHYKTALLLEKKYPKKKFYFFLDEKISFDQLENFNFIEMWVNSACPRVGWDDVEFFPRGVINLAEALQAEKILTTDSALTKA